MNWINEKLKPKIKTMLQHHKDVPDNLWTVCAKCGAMIHHKELKESNNVCPKCGFHMCFSPKQRFDLLFDDSNYEVLDLVSVKDDPLGFEDIKKYKDKLSTYRKKTGEQDAIKTAYGKINDVPAVISVFNFHFMGGSMGTAVGEALIQATDLAVKKNCAYIVIPASGGARMQEGMLSLMQLTRTTLAVNKVKDKGLPYIVVFANPTTGGVSASFAMLGDFHIAEKGAVIAFAGRRVIEQTIKQKLPDDFQTAEYLKDHGMVDMVVERKDLKETIGKIIKIVANAKK